MTSTTDSGHTARIVAAIILALLGIAGSIFLLRLQLIGELSFVSLCTISALIGVVIAFIDRVASFGSAAFKVEMARVEESRKEVERREKRVSDIVRILTEVADWHIQKHGLLFGTAVIEENKKWLSERNGALKALLDQK